MAKQLQLRRGTTSEISTFKGAEGEVVVDTTKNQLVVHDGIKIGGFPVAREVDLNQSMVQYLPMPYPKSTPPVGHLAMMGQTIDQVTYPILFSLYGGTLPDLRGQFLRGLDYGRGIDSGRVVLSEQGDSIGNHRHNVAWSGGGVGPLDVNSPDAVGFVATGGNSVGTTRDTGDVETRPKNIAFLYIVKAG